MIGKRPLRLATVAMNPLKACFETKIDKHETIIFIERPCFLKFRSVLLLHTHKLNKNPSLVRKGHYFVSTYFYDATILVSDSQTTCNSLGGYVAVPNLSPTTTRSGFMATVPRFIFTGGTEV